MTQTAIQLVAIDLDGTLLDDDKQIPAANRQALEAAVAQGVKIVICTGRTLPGVQDIIQALPFLNEEEFLILQNGAQTVVAQAPFKPVFEHFISAETRRQAVVLAQQWQAHGVQLVAFDNESLYLIGAKEANSFVVADAAALKTDITPMSEPAFLANEQLYKTMLLGPIEALDLIQASVPAQQWQALSMVRSQPVIIEILPQNVSKASGLAELAAYLAVSNDAIMAIGDQFNDVEMLQYAGVPVVMENAPEALKSLAQFVTLSNQNAGVAHAIQRLILEK